MKCNVVTERPTNAVLLQALLASEVPSDKVRIIPAEGESEAFIANLDARGMWLLPEELATVTESVFEELLSDLKEEIAKLQQRHAPSRD